MPVFVSYFIRKKNTFVIAEPIRYSKIKELYGSDFNTIAQELRKIMNDLSSKL